MLSLPPWADDCSAQWADASGAWFLRSFPFLQRRCASESLWYWSYTTTGFSTFLILHGFTSIGIPQSKEAGDATGSEAGLFGGTLRTIFQFMWVDLLDSMILSWENNENFSSHIFQTFPLLQRESLQFSPSYWMDSKLTQNLEGYYEGLRALEIVKNLGGTALTQGTKTGHILYFLLT